jgi:hypothetical protein
MRPARTVLCTASFALALTAVAHASVTISNAKTRNMSCSAGVTGLTDAQLKSDLPAGFDPAIWGQDAAVNNGWPYLLANPPQ